MSQFSENDKKELFSGIDELMKKAIENHIVEFIFNRCRVSLYREDYGNSINIEARLQFYDDNGQWVDLMNYGNQLSIQKP